jgi:hypothetical protein
MARTPKIPLTPVEPEIDDSENDTEFSAYMERLIPGCKSLNEMIREEIRKALLSFNLNPTQRPLDGPGKSETYLERQNAALLRQLINVNIERSDELTPSPPSEPLEDLPEPGPKKPSLKVKPTKSIPFWR